VRFTREKRRGKNREYRERRDSFEPSFERRGGV